MTSTPSSTELLADYHEIGQFDSGETLLDDWLRRRARANQISGATRTFVICEGQRVAGYYALASGAIMAESSPGRFRRNMPNPIPVAILARLAVDRAYQGKGMGRALFRDAARRVANATPLIQLGFAASLCMRSRKRRKNSIWRLALIQAPANR
jgi:GNAT superfamily N-acetyltransferase